MAAKKSPSKKKTVTKAVAKKKVAKKTVSKKKVAKKTVAKKTVTKKAPAKKKAVKKKAVQPATAKKEAPEKEASKNEAKKGVTQPTSAPTPVQKPKPVPEGKFTAAAVNMGHIFSLRPRVQTSFRQADFRTAKIHLQHEGFETLEDAVRAVAEKALELTLGSDNQSSGKRR